uniref:Uncharacterized protein n=1 Tax=Plectus sambesii TaxID=2011161 RepID=A0A914X2G4_9BILA
MEIFKNKGWPRTSLICLIITACVISFIWIVVFASLISKDIYAQLELFNKESTVIEQYEVDLHYLKKFDNFLHYSFYCSVFQCISSVLELCLIAFLLSGLCINKKYLSVSTNTIFLIMIMVQLVVAIVELCIFISIERSEPENEIFLLFSTFADRNPEGFKAIEETFSCIGYELTAKDKEISPTNNCTKTLRNTIFQTKKLALVAVICLALKVSIIISITMFYICLIRMGHKNSVVSASSENSENRGDLELQRIDAEELQPCLTERTNNVSNSQQNANETAVEPDPTNLPGCNGAG